MTDEEQLLERCLEGLATWQTSVSTCADHYQPDNPDVVADLRLAQHLQRVQLPEHEVATARARIRLTVFTAIEADLAATPGRAGHDLAPRSPSAESSHVEPPRRHALGPRLLLPHPSALLAAALILFALLGAWLASNAAANALPGSPLYGLKRAEEGIALATAWSDQRHGDVLLTMADRRLIEIRAKARGGGVAEVRTLAAEFDATMRDLIQLTATMQTHHEDSHRIAAGLVHVLAAENQAIRSAQQSGQTIIAQTLAAAAQDQQLAIQASNVTLPPISSGLPGSSVSSNSTSTGPSAPSPAATSPTPVVAPGVPPTGSTGGSSGGNGGSGGIGGKGGTGGSHGPGPHRLGLGPGSIGTASGSLASGDAFTGTAGQPAGTCLANRRQLL